MHRLTIALLAALAMAPLTAKAEEFTVASYNIENFHANFSGHRKLQAARKQPLDDPAAKRERDEAIREETAMNEEDQWEIAETITDPAFNPDILLIQEGPLQADLEYFNRRWLKEAYTTVIQLPTNVNPDRPQTLCIMMKPGFEIVDRRDQYFKEVDVVPNDRDNRLFARGPSFLKVRTPSGYEFWIGNTHQKSKGVRLPARDGNAAGEGSGATDEASPTEAASTSQPEQESASEMRTRMEREAAEWRFREAARTHQIIKELEAAGPTDVMLVGDMNDDVGMDKTEKLLGHDGMAALIGPPDAGLILATQKLIGDEQISFGGYWRPRYRSLIDHVVTTKSMGDQIADIKIFTGSLARVASDHYPVVVKVKADPATTPAVDTAIMP
ncbi:MAG TPA: endonuclease/exonuclease/phosphatase family protein [Tepidisphaeraceae bacterium]|jgi:hypothetical protein|nr:endonuclease/exonuclease/phosphatase family protein [Tepidisphaeraceae bacterium]